MAAPALAKHHVNVNDCIHFIDFVREDPAGGNRRGSKQCRKRAGPGSKAFLWSRLPEAASELRVLPYWTLFAILAIGSLFGQPRPPGAPIKRDYYLMFVMVLIALMIGTRYRVGGDWVSYVYMFQDAGRFSLKHQLEIGDQGYQALTWYVKRSGGEFWMVNLVCGTIFSWGLYRLARFQPEPWLATLVAFPYLVVVVAMGYTRQGVAIGFLMAGLARLSLGRSPAGFLGYVAMAATFHRTATLIFPIALLGSQKNRMINFLLIIVFGYVLTTTFLAQDTVDQYIQNYITASYNSQGAAIRVAMSVVPAVLFLVSKGRLGFNPIETKLWRNFAIVALALLVALFVLPSSTAVDRIALYVLPLQIVILSRLTIWAKANVSVRIAVIVYSAAILYVWLNYAQYSFTWIPYDSYLWH